MEELMQYVWQYRLWPTGDMVTVTGERIEVLDPGILNRDAGPDFFNAKLNIGGEHWVGNVEMHVRASDWHRHGHGQDRAYDTVVLHVVEVDDMQITRPDGTPIPQMVMRPDRNFNHTYHQLVNNPLLELPCSRELVELPRIYISDWITALAYERLFTKTDRIAALLERYQGNWSDVVYVTVARALGFSTNAEPFELLANSTPLKTMLRNSDSLTAVEAILYGQAGFLEGSLEDDYYKQLKQEYAFYATKYGLKRSPNIYWKMARMRPQNFPHRRIAALATMIYQGFRLGSAVLNVETEEQARALFDFNLMGYWARHFNFSPTDGGATPKAFSYSSTTVLLINVVVPLLYAYGGSTGDTGRQERAIDLLQTLKPESNSIVDLYRRGGLEATSAFDSQALIQLRRNYCLQRKCLFCRIGHRLLSARVKAPRA